MLDICAFNTTDYNRTFAAMAYLILENSISFLILIDVVLIRLLVRATQFGCASSSALDDVGLINGLGFIGLCRLYQFHLFEAARNDGTRHTQRTLLGLFFDMFVVLQDVIEGVLFPSVLILGRHVC